MINLNNKINSIEKRTFYFTLLIISIWYLIFGLDLINEPYIWDDLHFFRNYSNQDLKNIWTGNWDADGIETPGYRPFAVLYYHILYLVFGENTFLFRNFVIFEAFILILISNKLLIYLNFSERKIFFFICLIIFSKIFITLISWFTISVLILVYILSFTSILLFLISIEEKKKIIYFLSILISGIAIFTREELYIIPIVLFLIYFYKKKVNFYNLISISIKVLPFLSLVIIHILLRKQFIPEGDHLQIVDYTIKYGENLITFGGLIKAFKSSFLPMGYFSLKNSDLIQTFFSFLWITLIIFSLIIIIKNCTIIKDNLKKNFILVSLTLVCCLPHLTIPRAWGIFLPSFFALALIISLIDSLFLLRKPNKNLYNNFYFLISLVLMFVGILGGIYRSSEHAKAMNQYSLSIIRYDALFIYGFKHEGFNLSIPKARYLSKKKHLNQLKIYDFRRDDEIPITSKKIIINRYRPIWF